MIALIQRVSHAEVRVADRLVGEIGTGVLALIGVTATDDVRAAERLLDRILGYRIFSDSGGRMNLDVRAVGGGLLLVPQFTLVADTRKGTRASFSGAAAPDVARTLFDHLLVRARAVHSPVESGEFGAEMRVSLTNEGPVTFWLES